MLALAGVLLGLIPAAAAVASPASKAVALDRAIVRYGNAGELFNVSRCEDQQLIVGHGADQSALDWANAQQAQYGADRLDVVVR